MIRPTKPGKHGKHWDPAGHLQPKYAALRSEHAAKAVSSPEPRGFLSNFRDDAAQTEQSGAQFVQQVTTGEYGTAHTAEQTVAEKLAQQSVQRSLSSDTTPEADVADVDEGELPLTKT